MSLDAAVSTARETTMSATTTLLGGTLLLILLACGDARQQQAAAAGGDAETAATGGEYRPPPDLSQIDACELLPASQIPERFGKVIEGPTSQRDPNGWPRCSYVLAPNTGMIVELMESAYYDMNRGVWDQTRIRDVPGVGEKAFLVALKPPHDPYLIAAKGYVAVKVRTRKLDLAEEAARIVLGKL
jgi:hypothetical protein